jgi:hypothetical protein
MGLIYQAHALGRHEPFRDAESLETINFLCHGMPVPRCLRETVTHLLGFLDNLMNRGEEPSFEETIIGQVETFQQNILYLYAS